MEVRDYYLTVLEGAQRGVTPRSTFGRCLQDGDAASFPSNSLHSDSVAH